MGRRTKLLDTNTKDIILDYIRKGNYIKTACLAAGVSEPTFHAWVQRAESGNGGNGNKIYTEFLTELKKARSENIASHVNNIQEASKKPQNWTASAWLLERMEPADYGRRLEMEVGPSKVLLALQERASKFIDTPREGKEQKLLGSGSSE